MSPPVIAIIAAGAMGAAVAKRLTAAGLTVLTDLSGRSEATRSRARDARMQDVTLPQLASRANWVLSILPPSEALSFALLFLHSYSLQTSTSATRGITFIDCNAVNPDTAKKIGAVFQGSKISFLDAGIIGGPPQGDYNPVFYASADPESQDRLDDFEALSNYGLNISPLRGDGAGIGDASALKMSYAGISKGIIGICTAMILGLDSLLYPLSLAKRHVFLDHTAAQSSSPATAQALLHELAHSQPIILQRITSSIPGMLPKAHRWVGEMQEISSFVGGEEGLIHQGLASLYERVDKSLRDRQEGDDIDILGKFVEDAKRALEGKRQD